ncbi:MAG: trigger factor [Phycisphaeraceae bacterium]|nr:trigger factor [Phycisphaeraceae bacterium]
MNESARPADADAVESPEAVAQAEPGTETEEAPPRIEVEVEDIGPARKKLKAVIPGDTIKARLDSQMSELQQDAQVPGFRKGRVPMRLIEKRFGSTLRTDLRNQLVGEHYQQVLEQEDLVVVGDPDFGDLDKLELPEDGGDLTFEVTIEVVPDFEMPDYHGIEVKREVKEVTDEDVQRELRHEMLRIGDMELQDPDVAATPGDLLDATVRVLAGADAGDDAAEILNFPQAAVWVPEETGSPSGPIAGLMVDDLRSLTLGKKAGDEFRLSLTGPQSHEDERIRNQPVTVTAKINGVHRAQLTDVSEFAKMLGFEDESQLRETVKTQLVARAETAADNDAKRQICEHLLEKVEMHLPEGFSGQQLARVLNRQAAQLESEGVPRQEIEHRLAEMRSSTEESSRKEMKLFFTLARIAEQLGLDVSSAEVNGRISQIAMRRRMRPEKVRDELQRTGQIEQVFMQLREEKTLNALLDRARINNQEPKIKPEAADEAKDEAKDEASPEQSPA